MNNDNQTPFDLAQSSDMRSLLHNNGAFEGMKKYKGECMNCIVL